ncbi:protein kinase [Ophiostoma piceae UAMH 11346]|uniref:non-specific serine/threonine protein kinase n=1 Tax=Ophiostoma piceae (strain UAMH 11346) TaxID=1262450 RepID=S3CQJ5_OPHP1|nr:protein kinase [Ophiostoma piceae UAMH 11346]
MQRPLARIGTNRDCDIVLPEEFGQVELCFNVNSYSGEIVLHANVKNTTTSKKPRTAVDFRRRAWDKDDEEVRDILVHSGTQWAVVLHPDLTRPTSQQEKRQYRLQVGKAEFLIHPFDYGLGEHCPLPRQLNYMKSAFGFSGRSEYHHAIHMGVIKNVPIRRLGKGAQGVVWHVISTRNGYHFAQKKIDVGIYAESRILRDGLSATDVLKDEVILLQEIQGKQCSGNVSHIVPYLHTEGLEETTSEGVQIVTVYMDVYEGSLADMIASGKFRNLNEGMPLLMRMVKHMAIALSTLSSKNAIHRDVKPENILYNGDNFYLTEVYQAPEVLEGESHTTKVDVFSLGVTIAACLKSMQPTVIRDAYKTHKQTWPTYVSGILSVFGESQLASLVSKSWAERENPPQSAAPMDQWGRLILRNDDDAVVE